MKRYREASQNPVHRSNESLALSDEAADPVDPAEAEEPVAAAAAAAGAVAAAAIAVATVVEGSMADWVEDKEDMTAQKMLVRLELMK